MANLVRARSWGQIKPPAGSQIDRGHPLAQGLVICIPATEQGGGTALDIQRGLPLTYSGTGAPLWAPTRRGYGLKTASSGTVDWKVGNEGTQLTLPTGDCTVMFAKWRSVGGAANNGWGMSGAAGTSTRLGGHCPFSDGTVYFDYGGLPNRVSVAGLTVGDDIWTFEAGSRGQSIWQNGILRANATGAITRTATTDAFNIGSGNGQSVNETETRFAFFYLWRRQLSGDEIAWLNAEPYAFIQPPGPKILYFGLNAPAATPVTSTTIVTMRVGKRRAMAPRSHAIRTR